MDDLSFQPQQPYTTKKTTKFPRLFLALIILITLVGGGYFLFLHTKGTKQPAPVVVSPTPTSVPSATPAASQSPSPSAKVTPAGGTNRKDITVDVLNGSGVAGAAGKIASFLETTGYTLGTTGNADTFDYTNLTVKVKKSKAQYLDLLKKDLASKYTVDAASANLPESSTADAEVIVGK